LKKHTFGRFQLESCNRWRVCFSRCILAGQHRPLGLRKDSLFNQSWSLLIYYYTFRSLWFAKYLSKTFIECTQRTTIGGVSIIYGWHNSPRGHLWGPNKLRCLFT
jgi:hypothetical protein